MAEQHIRYVKTSDGVNIAYASDGEGPPVVFVSYMFGGLHMSSLTPRYKVPADRLFALGWNVINYDQRGTGSSDRRRDDFTLEAWVKDLESVINQVAPDRQCALVATTSGGPTAIAYAAQHPERVSRLVLRNSFACGAERHQAMLGVLITQALRPILKEHRDFWEMFTLTLANAMVGYADTARASDEAAAYRAGATPEAYLAMSDALDALDVSDLLESVTMPTLIVNDIAYITVGRGWGEIARDLTSRIPNARLVSTDDFASAVDQFLHEGEVPVPNKAASAPSGTAIILIADIADSTELTERLGDAAFRAKSRELDGVLRTIIRECGGTVIDAKTLGDGVLATFPAASQAIDAAVRFESAADAAGLQLHVGLHAGDVIREEGNVFGGAVNVAARISGLSAPSEVLVSDIVRGLARTSAGVTFEDRGEQTLKGVGEPVRVFAVLRER
jgi:class 3 adenylate cyclase